MIYPIDLEKQDMRDAFFLGILEHLKNQDHQQIVCLTADHGAFILDELAKEFPQQFINVGIAEQNMMNVAAGLALEGKKVFAYGITPFVSMRCFEQVVISIAAMRLHVNIVAVGAGFTYSIDGPTHHGLQDVAIMNSVPGMQIWNSSDPINTYRFAAMACEKPGPKYLRIEKGIFPRLHPLAGFDETPGFALLKDGNDLLILATGAMSANAMNAAATLDKKGYSVAVADIYCLKPFPAKKILELIQQANNVLTVEEHVSSGGLGAQTAICMAEAGIGKPLHRLDTGDSFHFSYDCREGIWARLGFDHQGIVACAEKIIASANSMNS